MLIEKIPLGISYPPPSPPRGALRRAFAIPQSRNPPLVKTRHISTSVTQTIQPAMNLDAEAIEERRRRLEPSHRMPSTSSIAEEKVFFFFHWLWFNFYKFEINLIDIPLQSVLCERDISIKKIVSWWYFLRRVIYISWIFRQDASLIMKCNLLKINVIPNVLFLFLFFFSSYVEQRNVQIFNLKGTSWNILYFLYVDISSVYI